MGESQLCRPYRAFEKVLAYLSPGLLNYWGYRFARYKSGSKGAERRLGRQERCCSLLIRIPVLCLKLREEKGMGSGLVYCVISNQAS